MYQRERDESAFSILPTVINVSKKESNAKKKKAGSYLLKYILAINFLEYLEAGAVPALLIQLTRSFTMSAGELGLLGGIVYISLSLSSPLAGYLLRHYDHQLVIGISVAVNNLLTLLWALTPVGEKYSTWLFIALRFLMGATQSVVCMFLPMWVNEFAPKDQKTTWMSYQQASVPFGVMMGYIIASSITTFLPSGIHSDTSALVCYDFLCWRWPFLIETALLTPFCVGIFLVPKEYINIKIHAAANQVTFMKENQTDKTPLTSTVVPNYQSTLKSPNVASPKPSTLQAENLKALSAKSKQSGWWQSPEPYVPTKWRFSSPSISIETPASNKPSEPNTQRSSLEKDEGYVDMKTVSRAAGLASTHTTDPDSDESSDGGVNGAFSQQQIEEQARLKRLRRSGLAASLVAPFYAKDVAAPFYENIPNLEESTSQDTIQSLEQVDEKESQLTPQKGKGNVLDSTSSPWNWPSISSSIPTWFSPSKLKAPPIQAIVDQETTELAKDIEITSSSNSYRNRADSSTSIAICSVDSMSSSPELLYHSASQQSLPPTLITSQSSSSLLSNQSPTLIPKHIEDSDNVSLRRKGSKPRSVMYTSLRDMVKQSEVLDTSLLATLRRRLSGGRALISPLSLASSASRKSPQVTPRIGVDKVVNEEDTKSLSPIRTQPNTIKEVNVDLEVKDQESYSVPVLPTIQEDNVRDRIRSDSISSSDSGGSDEEEMSFLFKDASSPVHRNSESTSKRTSLSYLWTSIYKLFHMPVYSNLLGAMTSLYFTVTGVQYWGTTYLAVALGASLPIVNILFVLCAATGPTLGVFFGGWLVDALGGYRGMRQRIVALELCTLFGFLGCCLAIPVSLVSNIYLAVIFLWGVLFMGAAVLPACSGILVSIVPRSHRPVSASINLVVTNLLGYSASLVLSGYLMQLLRGGLISSCGEVCALSWGFRLVLCWSMVSLVFLVRALIDAYRAQERRQAQVLHRSSIFSYLDDVDRKYHVYTSIESQR